MFENHSNANAPNGNAALFSPSDDSDSNSVNDSNGLRIFSNGSMNILNKYILRFNGQSGIDLSGVSTMNGTGNECVHLFNNKDKESFIDLVDKLNNNRNDNGPCESNFGKTNGKTCYSINMNDNDNDNESQLNAVASSSSHGENNNDGCNSNDRTVINGTDDGENTTNINTNHLTNVVNGKNNNTEVKNVKCLNHYYSNQTQVHKIDKV